MARSILCLLWGPALPKRQCLDEGFAARAIFDRAMIVQPLADMIAG